MGNRAAVLSQERDLVGIEMNPVRANQSGAEQPESMQAFKRAHTITLLAILNLMGCFMKMKVDR